MKVLLAFPQRDQQTGVYIKRAFEELGCELSILDPKIEPDKLYSRYREVKPDLVFISRTCALLDGINQIKTDNPYAKIVCWNVDKRNSVKEFGQGMLRLFDACTTFYTIARGNIEEYKQICHNTDVRFLQEACDTIDHGLVELTSNTHKIYDCDVAFIGSCTSTHPGREDLLTHLKNQDFNFRHHDNIFHNDHSKAVQCAKINISHNGWDSIELSMSARVYRIMCAGGFMLEQYCPGIEKWFDIGKDCDVYHSKEECVDKIKYYLTHDDERLKIAEHGRKTVIENHTFTHRMREVLKDMSI